jgi:uncharacterized RDD family membrane protein YckC
MAGIIATVNDSGARVSRPAGFWIRCVAALVDAVVILLARLSMGSVASRVWGRDIGESPAYQGLAVLFTLLFACVYTTVTHTATGQTIGKALTGVRVVAVDGRFLPVGAALLRWLATFVSALPLGMGYAMAGLRSDKRALHDLIAGSRVERVGRVARAAPARGSVTGPEVDDPGAPPATPWPPEGPRLVTRSLPPPSRPGATPPNG